MNMKLEKYEDKSKSKRKALLISLGVIVLISVSLLIYNNNLKENNDDVYFAFYNGNEKLDTMPLKDNPDDIVFDHGECDNGAEIEWNEEEWAPLVKNLSKSKTNCKLYFKKREYLQYGEIKIPITAFGDGLYKVEHNVLEELGQDWSKEEHRYAGVNPNNYVSFNNEIWRIIGLVNVKVGNNVEQRLKIVRVNGISSQKDFGEYSWDSSESSRSNNWVTSKLKNMLNGIYYNSEIGECWDGLLKQCDFSGSGDLPKGLDEMAQEKIDKEVIWNIGGSSGSDITINHFYEIERSTITGNGNKYPSEWSKETDTTGYYNGIGLIYPSDYGYATNGGNLGRKICFDISLFNWNSKNDNFQSECGDKDWLKVNAANYSWSLTPDASYSNFAFELLISSGIANSDVNYSNYIWPTLYLKSTVKIIENPHPELEYGSIDNPFILG